jgi:hypothetical protein
MSEELIDPVAPKTTAPEAPATDEQAHVDEQQPEEHEGAEPEPEQSAKARRSAQARINEITRAKHEAEREAAYWRGLAEGGKKQEAAPEAVAETRPILADYADYDGYVEALADWKAGQKVREALQQTEVRASQSKQEQEAREVARTWATRQDAARNRLPDYDDVVGSSSVTVAPAVTDAILTSDKGPDIAYHLAKNPAVVARLNTMSPIAAAREIGRLEAALEKPSTRAAPAVPEPASISRPARTQTSDPSQMSHEQYRAMRAKQGARWAQS